MAEDFCAVCECQLVDEYFDLQSSLTVHSKTRLFEILQKCLNENLVLSKSAICRTCYLLLDEFDRILIRSKAIQEQLKSCIERNSNRDSWPSEIAENVRNWELPLKVKVQTDNLLNKSDSPIECKEDLPIKSNPSNLLCQSVSNDTSKTPMNVPVTQCIDDKRKVDNTENYQALCDVNETNVKKFQCSQCPKTWKTKADLNKHMSAHTDERPYICEICGQGYKKKKALDIHVGMHNGINKYTCIYCNKSFTQKGGLSRHIPIHTGQQPYQCELCGKRFTHHTSFDIHKKSHRGTKSYQCDLCGLHLISASHLTRHKRIHTGEKKFSCSICGRKFSERYNLVAHEKLHAGFSSTRKHRCEVCNKIFSRQMQLEQHLLSVHQIYNLSQIEDSTWSMEDLPTLNQIQAESAPPIL